LTLKKNELFDPSKKIDSLYRIKRILLQEKKKGKIDINEVIDKYNLNSHMTLIAVEKLAKRGKLRSNHFHPISFSSGVVKDQIDSHADDAWEINTFEGVCTAFCVGIFLFVVFTILFFCVMEFYG